eukprot:1118618-Rhodomonas_salina.2
MFFGSSIVSSFVELYITGSSYFRSRLAEPEAALESQTPKPLNRIETSVSHCNGCPDGTALTATDQSNEDGRGSSGLAESSPTLAARALSISVTAQHGHCQSSLRVALRLGAVGAELSGTGLTSPAHCSSSPATACVTFA